MKNRESKLAPDLRWPVLTRKSLAGFTRKLTHNVSFVGLRHYVDLEEMQSKVPELAIAATMQLPFPFEIGSLVQLAIQKLPGYLAMNRSR